MILSTTRLIQHQRVLRELEAKFSFQKCVLGTTAALESVLGKSSAIPVCLSQSRLSHDVTCTLCYSSCAVCLYGRTTIESTQSVHASFVSCCIAHSPSGSQR